MPRYSDDDLELFIEIKDDLAEGVLEQWAAKIKTDQNGRIYSAVEYRGSILRAAIDAELIIRISENGVKLEKLNVPNLPGKRAQWYGTALEIEYRKYTEVSPKVSGQLS